MVNKVTQKYPSLTAKQSLLKFIYSSSIAFEKRRDGNGNSSHAKRYLV